MDAVQVVELIQGRHRFVQQWCAARGLTQDELTMDQILAIRKEPGWKTPAVYTSDQGDGATQEPPDGLGEEAK